MKFLGEYESPQLLLIEAEEKGDALVSALGRVAEVCEPGSKVVLLGGENDIFLYKKLMRMGLDEYYCGPLTPDALIPVVESLYSDTGSENLGRVISFFGARGGVGSTSLAANAAYALSKKFEESVILLDLDIAFGSIALGFNLQTRQSISDALAEPKRLDAVMIERFMLKYEENLSLIAAPSVLADSTQIDLESLSILLKLVRQMSSFVVLDIPHRWEKWVQEILLDSNEIVVTAYPNLVNLRDAKGIFEKLTPNRGVDAPTRLVFNRCGEFKKGELTAKDFEDAVGVKPSASVPYAPGLFADSVNGGDALAKLGAKNRVVKEIELLAGVVCGRTLTQGKKAEKGFLSRIMKSG